MNEKLRRLRTSQDIGNNYLTSCIVATLDFAGLADETAAFVVSPKPRAVGYLRWHSCRVSATSQAPRLDGPGRTSPVFPRLPDCHEPILFCRFRAACADFRDDRPASGRRRRARKGVRAAARNVGITLARADPRMPGADRRHR